MLTPFAPADIPELLTLLQTRVPTYFHPTEVEDYAQYLRTEAEAYWVWRVAGRILAAAGLNHLPAQQEMRLSWDVVHPESAGQGIGSQLTQHRIRQARQRCPTCRIRVRTAQLTWRFYEKQGFRLVEVKKDFWAQGFDLYDMVWEVGPRSTPAPSGPEPRET